MPQESDKKLLPDLLQNTLTVSLGAAYKGLELLGNPERGLTKVMADVKDLITVPQYAADKDLTEKAQSLAGVWMQKGAVFVSECRTAGEKITEGK